MRDPSIDKDQTDHALYKNSRIRKHSGFGVFNEGDSCKVEIQSGRCGPNEDTLKVNPGHVLYNGEKKRFDQQNIAIEPGNDQDPRKDVVYINKPTNTPLSARVSKGTPQTKQPQNATPEETRYPVPDAFAGREVIILAEIWVDSNAQSISVNDVWDRRSSSEVNYGKVHTDEINIKSDVSIGGEPYIRQDEVEPMIVTDVSGDRASTTSTSYTATGNTFKMHVQWNKLPSVNTACSVSFEASPGAGETLHHKLWNMKDGETVDGTEHITGTSGPVHTDWDNYSPTTQSNPITLTSLIKTSNGQNQSEIIDAAFWLGKSI